MFRLPSFDYVFRWMKSTNTEQTIDIPPLDSHDLDRSFDKRGRTLRYLIRANHINHAVLYNNSRFHNHMVHILSSAWVLGSDAQHLRDIYDSEAKVLDPWKESPSEVSQADWVNHLGDKRFERAFLDFFEDELTLFGYNGDNFLLHYLFAGPKPLFSSLIGGLGHPLIHLGYSFEFYDSYELYDPSFAIEALTLAAVSHNNDLSKYLEDPSYTRPSPNPTTSLSEILSRVYRDKRFNDSFRNRGASNLGPLLEMHEKALLEYWNSWEITNAKAQFEDSQRVATLLLLGTTTPVRGQSQREYDFFLVHVLTTSHAVRTILPLIPKKYHVPLVRQWWLFALMTYITQLRPPIVEENILEYELKGRDWDWAVKKALESQHSLDAHYVKAIRALKEAASLWGDKESWYLRAAVRFADEFKNWTGWDPLDAGEVAFREQMAAQGLTDATKEKN